MRTTHPTATLITLAAFGMFTLLGGTIAGLMGLLPMELIGTAGAVGIGLTAAPLWALLTSEDHHAAAASASPLLVPRTEARFGTGGSPLLTHSPTHS